MSYLTENEPNLALVEIFTKLPKEDLDVLAVECKAGNYGILSTAIKTAHIYTNQPGSDWMVDGYRGGCDDGFDDE